MALLLFSLGSVFALYEGIHKLSAPEDLTSPLVAVVILLVAIALEALQLPHRGQGVPRRSRATQTWWGFIRSSVNPELPVVLLEDFGALRRPGPRPRAASG